MVKCVVSGCPNRADGSNRTHKRFFSFPKDPSRVKVWLAALRQTEQTPSHQDLICEDHFLPEDVWSGEVGADAIPIMPPCPDGPMGMLDPWGGGAEEEEEEEEQWGGAQEEEEEEGSLPFNARLAEPEPAHLDPPPQLQGSSPDPFSWSGQNQNQQTASLQEPVLQSDPTLSASRPRPDPPMPTLTREDVSLPVLTRRFLELLRAAPDGCLDLRVAVERLRTRRRRLYDITNVMEGVRVVRKESVNRIKWIGSGSVCGGPGRNQNQNRNRSSLADLKLVEETLDSLIRTGAEQLYSLTDDPQNSPLAYVTLDDLGRLAAFQDQKLMVVKAPAETRLEVPPPSQDRIQVRLKGGRGPILVLTCDLGPGGGAREGGGFLSSLEDSRIQTAVLLTGPETAVQSA